MLPRINLSIERFWSLEIYKLTNARETDQGWIQTSSTGSNEPVNIW